MKKSIFAMIAILPSLAVASEDVSFNPEKFYLNLGAGYSWNDGENTTYNGVKSLSLNSSKFVINDTGFFTVGAGCDLGANLRGSIDYSYMSSAMKDIRQNTYTASAAPLSGDVTIYNTGDFSSQMLMVNFFYDIKHVNISITPYVMGGAGVAFNKTSNMIETYGGSGVSAYPFSKTNADLAWQVGFGISKELSKKVSIDLGYRFLDRGKFVTQNDSLNDKGVIVTGNKFSFEDMRSHQLMIGVRFKF